MAFIPKTQTILSKHKVGYSIAWGLLAFCICIIALELLLANDIYSYSTSDQSEISSGTLETIKANKTALFIEFAIRGFFGKGRYDNTCRTKPDICSLADIMAYDTPPWIWSADTGADVSFVGIVTGLIASFYLRTLLKME